MKNYLSKAQYLFFRKGSLGPSLEIIWPNFVFSFNYKKVFLNRRFKFRRALREGNVEIIDHLRNIISRSYNFTCQNYF